MGSFGYMCPVCETSIRGNCSTGGELCVLIHKRHGREIGRTVGHYDEYGGVAENEDFRGHNETYQNGKINRNSHKEMCESEMRLGDSNAFGRRFVLPDGEPYDVSWLSRSSCDFFDMDERFESFAQGLTPALKEKVDILRKGRAIFFGFNPSEPLSEEEMNLIKLYLKSDVSMEEDLHQYLRGWIESLPKLIPSSGTVAVHKKCYDSLSRKEQKALPISKHDPDQSWGKVRKKYC